MMSVRGGVTRPHPNLTAGCQRDETWIKKGKRVSEIHRRPGTQQEQRFGRQCFVLKRVDSKGRRWWEGKNSREKKIFGFVENERAERERESWTVDQRTFECD